MVPALHIVMVASKKRWFNRLEERYIATIQCSDAMGIVAIDSNVLEEEWAWFPMLVLLLAIRAWCSCCWCNTNSRYDPKIVRVSYGRRPDRNEMAPTWAPDLCRSMGTYWVRNGQTYPSVWFRNRAKAMLDDGRSQYLQHGNMLYLYLPLTGCYGSNNTPR